MISNNGIKIDLARVNAILKVEDPRRKKEVQSFIGQINFLRRLIPIFVKILRNITNVLKKENEIKWEVDARNTFKDI